MKEKEAMEIVQQEQLTRRINWYDDENLRENQVGIRKAPEGWEVYITGERAEVISGTECLFNNSEDAHEALIRKARYVKKLFG